METEPDYEAIRQRQMEWLREWTFRPKVQPFEEWIKGLPKAEEPYWYDIKDYSNIYRAQPPTIGELRLKCYTVGINGNKKTPGVCGQSFHTPGVF